MEHIASTMESDCYDGDVESESCLSASSSSAAGGSTISTITDPSHYVTRTLTDRDKYELLTSPTNLPCEYQFPVTSGRKFNPSRLLTRQCYVIA